jgi:hypothetical protein
MRTLLFTSELVFPELICEFVRLDDLWRLLFGGVGVSKGSKVLKKTGLAGLSMERGRT